jgi:pimeloyl-ACP methyl ester carboxylesterase
VTVVLVHGVPETERVWDLVRAEWGRDDVVALSLPGFGRPLPEGFEPTKEAYVAWLVGELERLGEPVDLVGHDWGGGFTNRLVSQRPDLVRKWVTDAAGLVDAEGFEWHDFAKTWQTPGEGEAMVDAWLATPVDERAAIFTAEGGVPADLATILAAALDRTMTDAILTLYRSATAVHTEWGPDFVDIPKPGLVVVPSEDPFLSETSARRAAAQAGAEVVLLDGLSHWWILADPARAVSVLDDFLRG